jgi:hypothetical protein
MRMTPDPPLAERMREARLRMARHLAGLHRLHLALAEDSRALKRFTVEGRAAVEIEAATAAFLENMHGRFEARLGLLRRGEPLVAGRPEGALGHGAFWLAFSRLCAVLRRVERRAMD